MEWFIKCLKNYANFNGRARRKEFWMFTLINGIIGWLISFVLALISPDLAMVAYVYYLAVFLPSLAVGVRRLHGINKKGTYILISLIPLIGGIIYIIWCAKAGDKGDNQYGPDPKAVEA